MKTNTIRTETDPKPGTTPRRVDSFGQRREAKRHAALGQSAEFSRAVSPLRSAAALHKPAALWLCAFALILSPLCLWATTNDLSGLLQRGLFEEEANRNLEAAAQNYQSAIKQFDKDRKLAATAVFRLGEVYRKQGKTNEATALYERVVAEFSDQTALVGLSQAHLEAVQPGTRLAAVVPRDAFITTEEAEEIKRIQALIKNSPDLINAANVNNATPLYRAAAMGQLVVAQFLLDNGAIIAKGSGNDTPLHGAVSGGHKAMVELLLDRGADVNAPGNLGNTPLHIAAERGFKAVAEALLARGADVTQPGKNGETPLHWAAEAGQLEMVKSFLKKGAEVNAADQNGAMPLHRAARFGREDVVVALIEAGAHVRAATKSDAYVGVPTGSDDYTPLHYAAEYGRKDIAALLLKHGADINARNKRGLTPMDLVQIMGIKTIGGTPPGVSQAAMLEFLREHGGSSSFVVPAPAGIPPSAPQIFNQRYGIVPNRTLRQPPFSPGKTDESDATKLLPGRAASAGLVYSPDPQDAELLKSGFRRDPSAKPRVMEFWQPRATADVLPGRSSHSVVWTGKELLVFGGEGMGVSFGDGARYDLENDRWSLLSAQGASPSARTSHTAVWTGRETILWGGFAGTAGKDINRNDGGRFDPVSNSWNPVSTQGAPTARFDHTAVWTGTEMVVWGGYTDSHSWYQGGWADAHLNSGGRYNPGTDAWKETATTGAPSKRFNHVAVWTGREMIIWGGGDGTGALNDGGRYNPATDTWQPISTKNAPSPRVMPVVVWTGKEMIVWGGSTRDRNNSKPGYFTDGGRYNPETDTWKRISAEDIEKDFPGRVFAMAVWTGSEMIIWGGVNDALSDNVNDPKRYMQSGARYNPATDKWAASTTQDGPSGRLTRGVWTGENLLIFGGYNNTHLNDTWLYSPQKTMHPYSRDSVAAFQIRRVFDTPGGNSEELPYHDRRAGGVKLHVEKTVLLDATAIASAEVSTDPVSNLSVVDIKFTEAGKARFAQITRENIGQRLAIVVNGVVNSAPTIRTEIPGGTAQISGNFTPTEAEELAALLNTAAQR